MSEKKLSATVRERAGKGAARAVRYESRVPGVVYGLKKSPEMVILDPRDIVKELQSGIFFNTVFTLDIDGKEQKVLPRDVQFHVVKDTVEHIDFLRVSDTKKVKVSVPLEVLGREKNAAIRMGGRLQVVRRDVEVLAPSTKIPQKLTLDVSKLKFGATARISSIDLGEGVTPVIFDRDFVLATMKAPRGAASLAKGDEEETE